MLVRKLVRLGLIFFISWGSSAMAVEVEPIEPIEPIEDPLSLIGSLKGQPIHLPDLKRIVRDKEAAIELGKAFFYEINAGSDLYACATCHFAAGADGRISNQLSPGLLDARKTWGFGGIKKLGGGESSGTPPNLRGKTAGGQQGSSNLTLTPEDFPLHQLADVNDRNSAITYTTNDVVSSEGTFSGAFQTIVADNFQDSCGDADSTVFGEGLAGLAHRRVEPRNAPTTINAVFNHRNFWDGRANNRFNGVDPFGDRNKDARVLIHGRRGVTLHRLQLDNAALASQAAGPPVSPMEMACEGKNFTDIAKKLLPMRALKDQEVSSNDSHLGSLVHSSGKGLNATYEDMIVRAFNRKFWGAGTDDLYKIENNGSGPFITEGQGYTQMENNFSMFWSIAIMLYESTLVSDDSPVDRYFDGDGELSASETLGMNVFVDKGKCVSCHKTAMFTGASTLHLIGENAEDGLIERMGMAQGANGTTNPAALYDNGFYNIGVTPTVHDIGLGGLDPWGNTLSHTRQYIGELKRKKTVDPFSTDECKFEVRIGEDVNGFDDFFTNTKPVSCGGGVDEHGATIVDTVRVKGKQADKLAVAVDGAFKTPTLRNVGLTAPYMHNGGMKTLMETVEFYDRGGNRRGNFGVESRDNTTGNLIVSASAKGDTSGTGSLGRPNGGKRGEGSVKRRQGQGSNMDPDVVSLGLSEDEKQGLVDFMLALTDDRVACMKAPFDGPQIPLPSGHGVTSEQWVGNRANDNLMADGTLPTSPATGADGLPGANLPCLENAGDLFNPRNVSFGKGGVDTNNVPSYPGYSP